MNLDKPQDRQLVINTTPFESRIALLEGGELRELLLERHHHKGLVGNIYKGVVTRVLPGMNAAFVDIGMNRSAFLFGGDAFEGDYFLRHPDQEDHEDIDPDDDQSFKQNKKPIECILHDGQQIIVQVAKEALGTKGPRVTMHLSIPGRFLVLMPKEPNIGISRRIEKDQERERLKQIVVELLPPKTGAIIRTAAKDSDEDSLKREVLFLRKIAQKIETDITLSKAPSLLYCDLDLIKKATRDLFDEHMSKIIIDDTHSYHELYTFLSETIPKALPVLELYQDRKPIFDCFGMEIDIARALGKRIDLPSGGYLIIEQTEALTAFDVNTGKFVGKSNARQTILKTNMEAVVKVVEQLRLRNIGGIIIVDFIDMDSPEDRESVFDALQLELKSDRSRTNVLKISELGLVQMTRKRTSQSLERQMMEPCVMCSGKGLIRSVETESYELLREIVRSALQTGKKSLNIKVRPDIKKWMQQHLASSLNQIKNDYQIDLEFDDTLHSLNSLREPAFEVTDSL